MANLVNLGVAEFKKLIGAEKVQILKNSKTDKLFASASNGQNFKVELKIDLSAPIVVLMEEGDIDSACFINERKGGAEELLSL